MEMVTETLVQVKNWSTITNIQSKQLLHNLLTIIITRNKVTLDFPQNIIPFEIIIFQDGFLCDRHQSERKNVAVSTW